MDLGTGGYGGYMGHVHPLFNNWSMCIFSCTLIALLENFENAKMNRKIHVSGDFRRPKFQNFLAPGPPSSFALLKPPY